MTGIVIALSFVNILGLLLLLFQSDRRGKKQDEMLERLARIEAQYEGVPDHEDIRDVAEQLSGLVTDVATINERWTVTNRMMGTIQQHLLDEDKRK